jgi:hypothetical protein
MHPRNRVSGISGLFVEESVPSMKAVIAAGNRSLSQQPVANGDRMPENLTSSAAAYLNCEQAGAHLNLSPRTLEKFRTIGGGPRFRKLGRRIVYKVADLDAWAESRACESTSDPAYTALRD